MYNQKMTGHTNLVTKKIRRNSKWLKTTIHQKTVITSQTRTHRTEMHPETHRIRILTARIQRTGMHRIKMRIRMHMIKMQKIRMLTIMEMKTAIIKICDVCKTGRVETRPVLLYGRVKKVDKGGLLSVR